MSDATSPARNWTWPAWVEEMLSDRGDIPKSIPQDPLEALESAIETFNIARLAKLKEAAETQSHWLDSELDRLRKEKAMLSAGKNPYTEEEEDRLCKEEESQFIDDSLRRYYSPSDEEAEHRDDKHHARNEIIKFVKLIKEGKEGILKVEQEIMEIMEIKTQQKV